MSTTGNPIVEGGKENPPLTTRKSQTRFARNETFTRNETFSRNDTFANQRNTDYGDKARGTFDFGASHMAFDGLSRTLTGVGNMIDPDGEFTKKVITDYVSHAEDAQGGELPLPTGFARKARFWKIVVLGGATAVVIAGFAAMFINMIDNIPAKWASCHYSTDSTCGDWYTGEKWWMLVTTGAGFSVGLIRYLIKFPREMAGLFKEIEEMHVDYYYILPIYALSMISLSGGATLGPEQALINVGGGIATLVTDYAGDWWFETKDHKNLFVLGGMAAALGALFTTPMLGATMIHELGAPPLTFMESFSYLTIISVIGFAMYYSLVTNSYVDHLNNNTIFFTLEWLEDGGYKNWMVVTSFIFGVCSAGIAFICLLSLGIFRQVFNRMRERLEGSFFLAEVLPPTIAGLAIGAVNWALPATVGNGKLVLGFLIKFGISGDFTKKQLLCTGFARIFLFGVSTQAGFVGGIIFPLITLGSIVGTLAYQYFDYLDPYFCVSAFMCGIPMAVVPLPITFPLLITYLFFYGSYQAVPILLTGIVSYCTLSGSGLIKKLALVNMENQRRAAAEKLRKQEMAASERGTEAKEDRESAHSAAKREEGEFTVGAYQSKAKGKGLDEEKGDDRL